MEIRDFLEIDPGISLKKAIAIYDFFWQIVDSLDGVISVDVDSYNQQDRHISVTFTIYDSTVTIGYWSGQNALQLCTDSDILHGGKYDYETDSLPNFIDKFWNIVAILQDSDFFGF